MLVYATVHWTDHVLQATRNTRPRLTGHPVSIILLHFLACLCAPPPLTKSVYYRAELDLVYLYLYIYIPQIYICIYNIMQTY